MKKWETINKLRAQNSKLKSQELIRVLLENRGIKTKKEIEEFLNPDLSRVTLGSVGIDKKQVRKAVDRINKAIKNQEQIVVFGDYDVDGICATAILWETLNKLGAKVLPYIPHRIDEGYGLSIKGINNVILNLFQNPKSGQGEMPKPVRHDKKGLIITVDNGIVANEPVEFANKQGIDVIITDHHLPPAHSGLSPSGSKTGGAKALPKALAIVHTTKVCGAGVAYLLSNVILNSFQNLNNNDGKISKQVQDDKLELAAMATIADMVPLIGANRTLVKFGLEELKKTKRVGLLELFKEAVLDQSTIGVYEVGHVIAPRLNAMGRLDYAMDSLRLLCTKNSQRAKDLALKLGSTNRERQQLTIETTEHAKVQVSNLKPKNSNLLFIVHESYQPGVIGLVAGKLVEEFYRPAIVISKGEKFSKASARSVHGFNIIEFIRGASEFLIDAGGHPMAAGFTVETEKISLLQKKLEDLAQDLLDGEKLTRVLRVDCELFLSLVDEKLYDEIQKLSPFGMGNPEPTFVSKSVLIEEVRLVGREGKHLKLQFRIQNSEFRISGIGFGLGDVKVQLGDKVNIAYIIDQNLWNGNKSLQLKIKDIKVRV